MQVLRWIEFDTALDPDDPRNVPTEEARGSRHTRDRIARKLGLDLASGVFVPPDQKHVLFFGHTGSGKTTELRKIAGELHRTPYLFKVEVDVLNELDPNNLRYPDVLLAAAKRLIEELQKDNAIIPDQGIRPLEDWYKERVRTQEQVGEFTAAIETGAEAKPGLPFLGNLFAKATAAAKTNATYKESLREVVRNTYTAFAEAFNTLVQNAEEKLSAGAPGKVRIFFVIDGTDKLSNDDTRHLFIWDVAQLLAIRAFIIYTAPIHLKYEGAGDRGKLDMSLVLPMIKLCQKDNSPHPPGRAAMREILLRRADASLFERDEDIDRLVEYSGGHPRDLLRLLALCCEISEEQRITGETVTDAIAQLASEYRRFLEPEDYPLLAQVDAEAYPGGNDERTRRLLYELALLEYNDGSWRKSHPVIRTLEAYVEAKRKLEAAG